MGIAGGGECIGGECIGGAGGGECIGAAPGLRRSDAGSGAADVNTSSSSWIEGNRARTTTTSSVPDFGTGRTILGVPLCSSDHGSRIGCRGARGAALRAAALRWLGDAAGTEGRPSDEGSGARGGGGGGGGPGGDDAGPPEEGGGGGALEGFGGFGAGPSGGCERTAKSSPRGVGGGGGKASGGSPKLGGGGAIPLGDVRAAGGDGVVARGDVPGAPTGGGSPKPRSPADTSVISSPSGVRGTVSGGVNPGGGGVVTGRASGPGGALPGPARIDPPADTCPAEASPDAPLADAAGRTEALAEAPAPAALADTPGAPNAGGGTLPTCTITFAS